MPQRPSRAFFTAAVVISLRQGHGRLARLASGVTAAATPKPKLARRGGQALGYRTYRQ